MHANSVYFLAALLFFTAISVVKVRHEHRLAYTDLQAQKRQHDVLVDEWGQLLTEENTFAFPHRIEKEARSQLSMKKPDADDIVYLDLDNPIMIEQAEVDSAELALQEAQR